jgi:hypothetical protein
MKQIIVIFLVVGFSASSQSKTFQRLNDIEKDVKELLPEGLMSFDVMDEVIQSERQLELTAKFQQAVRVNYEWFLKYAEEIREPGKPLPFHENFGLSEDEYEELLSFIGNIELASSRVIEYNIIHGDHTVILEPTEPENYFRVKVNFESNEVFFDAQTLTFKETVVVDDPQNGFKSEWFGYQWRFEDPEEINVGTREDLLNAEMSQYKFTVGFLERTGKTYVQIKGREFSKGIQTKAYELPLVQH